MQLRKDSRLVRFSYWPSNEVDEIPPRTSLCAFFWRTFVFKPLIILVGTLVVGTLTFLILRSAYHHRTLALHLLGLAVLITLIVYLLNRNSTRVRSTLIQAESYIITSSRSLKATITASTFWQGLRTIKGKVCPIIDLIEDDAQRGAQRWD